MQALITKTNETYSFADFTKAALENSPYDGSWAVHLDDELGLVVDAGQLTEEAYFADDGVLSVELTILNESKSFECDQLEIISRNSGGWMVVADSRVVHHDDEFRPSHYTITEV